jgi:long-chain fatty acid transport protein
MNSTTKLGRGGLLVAAALFLLLAAAPPADATNGYFTHGYGTTNKGLAGAGVALPQDALCAATNPAGLAFLDHRYDVGLAVFNPNRKYTVTGSPSGLPGTFGLTPGTVESGTKEFFIPHFAGNWELSPDARFGVAVYGHGGMNTDYPTATFYAGRPTGVNLSQLFVVPSYARSFAGGKHALGVGLILAYQQFEIKGVGSFAPFSSDPGNLSNNGADSSTGAGVKLGYLGRFTPKFSFGASYQSQIAMGKFSSYRGLFAEQGGFDIPATATVGVAVKATPALTLVFDVQETYFSTIKSVGNPLFPNLVQARLGDDGGAGFGWRDMTTYKAGAQWAPPGSSWTWRFGFSTGDQPIPSSEVLFNILAPGVIEDHATLGFTKELAGGHRAVSFALMRAFSHSVSGPNPLDAPTIEGQQQIELQMDQWEAEVAYSWGF